MIFLLCSTPSYHYAFQYILPSHFATISPSRKSHSRQNDLAYLVFTLDTNGDATLRIFGDDGKTPVAYLGANPKENNGMNFWLKSKSKIDKRSVTMTIGKYGGVFQSHNKMGEAVAIMGVGNDGGGLVDLRDKFGYKR